MLNLAEKRLVSEWMDLGGQYYNNLAANGSPVRWPAEPDRLRGDVFPILQSDCASCHQPNGNSGARRRRRASPNNRFVLAGSVEGDFNVTLTMISDVCRPSSSALLRRPSTAPHPRARPEPDDRRLPGRQRQLQHHRQLDRQRLPDPMTKKPPCRDLPPFCRCRAAASPAVAAATRCPTPTRSRTRADDGQKLSFIYFQVRQPDLLAQP